MKRRTLKSRLLAFLLVLCMVVGLTPVYAVSDGEYETLELDVPKLVAVEAGETVTYKFIPEETGEYVVLGWYEMGSPRELVVEGPNASCKEMKNSAYRCSLTAGEEYTFSFINNEYNFETREVTVTTLVQPEGLTILGGEESIELYAGEMCAFSATTFPENAAPQRGTIWTCSDGSEYEGRYYFSSWYNTGTFVLTATAIDDPSLTDSITVVVKQRKKVNMSVGETVELTLEPGESAEITCEVEEAGNYIFYQPKGEYQFEIDHYPGDWENDDYVGQVFESTEGKPITIRLSCSEWCESAVTRSITIVKGTKTEGIEIVGEDAGLVGQTSEYSIRTTPEFGVSDRDCKWSVSDESIAELAWYDTTYCDLTFKAAGTVTLTATSQSNPALTASFEITVKEPEYIQVGETKQIDLQPGEPYQVNFYTNGKAGQYMFMIPRDFMAGFSFGSNSIDEFWFWNDEYECMVFDLPAEGNVFFEIMLQENQPATSTTLTLVEAKAATDIAFTNGDTVEMSVGENVTVPFTLVDGNYLRGMDVYSSDYDVVWIKDCSGESLTLYSDNAGTATITVVDENGLYKELTVISHPYGYNISDENKWVGFNDADAFVTFEYTPKKDGYYFIHHRDVPDIVPAEGSEQPLNEFWHNDYGHWGNVYQLEGGKTYKFTSEFDFVGDYAYYIKEIQMADDFAIPTQLTGAVNENIWLWIECDGVIAPTFKSSNENVVLLGSGSSDGVSMFLINEGTAEITVTDQNGNVKTCTVTVSGKAPIQEFEGWANFALAAGNSITYSFTPWESGLYLFYIEMEQNVKLDVTENGQPVAHKFNMNPDGLVYELKAGTEYQLTASCDETVTTYLFTEVLEEATKLVNYTEDFELYVGDYDNFSYALETETGDYGAGEVTVTSSDESVVEIVYSNRFGAEVKAVGIGTATLTATDHNGQSVSCEITVVERPVFELGKVEKQTLKPGEGPIWSFTAEHDGYYEMTITTSGKSVFASACNDDAGSGYIEEEFDGPATFTHKQYMKAGEEWLYLLVNLEEEVVIDTTMVITISHEHKLTKVNAVAPTYETAGNVEYYTCSVCGKLFLDAEGKTETTKEAIVLAQLIKVEENTAIVSPEAVDKAIEEAAKADDVVIDLVETGATEVELSAEAMDALVQAEKPLTVVTGDVTVTLDVDTLVAISESANGKEITVCVEQIEAEVLNEKQQEAIADREVLVTISASVLVGNEYVDDFKGGKATVKVPLKLEEGETATDYAVFFLDDEGKLTPVETYVKDGDIYFVTDHFSEYVVMKTVETEKGDPTIPNTGDNSNLFMMTALLLASMIGMACVIVSNKKSACVGKRER